MPKLRLPATHSLPPGRWVAIHPGSGSERKNWPIDRWLELLRFLQEETDFNFLLTGGEAEGTRLQQLAASIAPVRLHRAERLPLAELASAFQQCHHFLGHDSGITHLAAAVGCPVTALWGPSRRVIWQPNNPQVRIIEAPGGNLENLAVSSVCEFLRQVL